MRIVFLGSGEFALPTLRWLENKRLEVPLVITQPPRGSGRGRRSTATPVATWARDTGWDVIETTDVNDEQVVTRLRAAEATLGLVIAFGQKLGEAVRSAFSGGCVNLHASLLPKYRGAAPINWAIVHGEERTGCTVFRVVERMDAGPILSRRWSMIKPDETAGELHDRLAAIGVDAVEAALNLFEAGTIPLGEEQDHAQATKAPKLSKRDGYVDFARGARAVCNHILGMTPWPGATTRFSATDGRWESVQIVRARPAADPAKPALAPGGIDDRRYVAAQDAFVEILEIKPSSGRVMTWPDYVNGRRVVAGDNFVRPD